MTPRWIILRCSGRATLRLAQSLAEDGFGVWTPVRRETIRRARWNARRNVEVPLCAGIVFADADRVLDLLELAAMPIKPRHAVGLKGILRDPLLPGGYPVLDDAALDPLRLAELPAKVRRRQAAYSRGDGVKVTEGAFAGFPAIVDTSDRRNAKVWITIFGRHQRVELPTSILRLDDAYALRSETGTAARKAA